MTRGLPTLLADASARLRQAGVASPEFDCWALLSHVLDTPRGELHASMVRGDFDLTTSDYEAFWSAVSRRESREPLWHITGRAPFLDGEVAVGPGVFTPRPETELLAQQAIHDAQLMEPSDGELRVVDLCAGSGAVGIAVAKAVPYATLLAVEISDEAAGYLARNLEEAVPGRFEMMLTDVANLDHSWRGRADLVVSNPPYLIPGEPLDWETHTADPERALFGGDDGLEVIRHVVDTSRQLLRSGGIVSIEHGVDHGEQVRALLDGAGFRLATTQQDLLGRDRFTRAARC